MQGQEAGLTAGGLACPAKERGLQLVGGQWEPAQHGCAGRDMITYTSFI